MDKEIDDIVASTTLLDGDLNKVAISLLHPQVIRENVDFHGFKSCLFNQKKRNPLKVIQLNLTCSVIPYY